MHDLVNTCKNHTKAVWTSLDKNIMKQCNILLPFPWTCDVKIRPTYFYLSNEHTMSKLGQGHPNWYYWKCNKVQWRLPSCKVWKTSLTIHGNLIMFFPKSAWTIIITLYMYTHFTLTYDLHSWLSITIKKRLSIYLYMTYSRDCYMSETWNKVC